MLIRDDQFNDYLQQDEQAFIRLIVKNLQQENPDLVEGISDEGLGEMVSNGVARARSHGFRSDGDVMAFVAVMFEIAPNFDEQPDIRRALSDTSIPIDKRFNELFNGSLSEAWEEAANNYDLRAWHPGLDAELEAYRQERARDNE